MTSAQQLEGMQCLQALQNTVGETWGKWEWAQHFFLKDMVTRRGWAISCGTENITKGTKNL